jgi:hypothetical protein
MGQRLYEGNGEWTRTGVCTMLRPLRLLSKAFDKAIVPLPHHSYDISNPKIMGELVSGDPNNIKV